MLLTLYAVKSRFSPKWNQMKKKIDETKRKKIDVHKEEDLLDLIRIRPFCRTFFYKMKDPQQIRGDNFRYK